MHCFLGIDNGGSTTKAAVYNELGQELGSASVDTRLITPYPDHTERDLEELWQANCRVIKGALERSGTDAGQLTAVGLCGHGKGLYLWGKDGRPVRPGIVSTDNRAARYPVLWKHNGVESEAFKLSCQHVLASQPVSLLNWLRDMEPDNYKNIWWIFSCKDYIRFRLTGSANAEITDCSGTNLINLRTGNYDPELLRLFGLDDLQDCLPPVCGSLDICARISAEAARDCGLREGTPVIGGMFDIDACALAVGLTDEKSACMIAGTWSINEYIRKEPVTDGSVLMNSLFCLPGYYLIEESSPTSAANSGWFVRQLLPELCAQSEASNSSIFDALDSWIDGIGPSEFVPIFLPFVMASNAHPHARGCWLGINASHGREHLLRGVYEGIAFSHRQHYEKLLSSRRSAPELIRLAGGAARSKPWAQMFADIMKTEVMTVDVNETGALGCAIAAAAATGVYPTVDQAAAHMCGTSKRYLPNMENAAIYDIKYSVYQKSIACLDGLWDDMQALVEA